MERSFSLTVAGKPAGKVTVQRQGLYDRFSCRCKVPGDGMYRLMVTCGNHRETLGVLIPKDDSFVLETKVPSKRIGEGDMTFSLFSKQQTHTENFVPICPEEPFRYISRLKESFLVQKDGQLGILIEEKQE